MNKPEFNSTWSALHGGAEIKGIVKAWLAISFSSAKFLSKVHVTPNILTILGVIFAIAMAVNPLSLWTIPLLVLSLYADGIDGSVAIFQGRNSSFGAILDASADRVSEALWFYVAYKIGAPAWLILATYIIASTQEYARARLGGLGISDLGVVTPAERPVRASFIFIALLTFALGIDLVFLALLVLFVLQVFSFYLVARYAHNSLRNNLSA